MGRVPLVVVKWCGVSTGCWLDGFLGFWFYGVMEKLTVEMDPEVLQRLRLVAVSERRSMTEIVRGLIEGYLGGAPVVVADAPARTVEAVPVAPVIPSVLERPFRGPDPKGGKK